MANEIVTEVRLELDKFRADLARSEKEGVKSAERVGESIGKMGDGLKDKFLELGAVVIGAFAFEKVIEAAREEEDSLNTLNQAMSAAGIYSKEASERFQEFAESLQNSTRFGKGVIEQNAALLISLGRLSGEGLERATQAALDLTAGMAGRIGVEQAFNLVAKASEGSLTGLKKVGIFIHETGDEAKDFARALEQINARFGGAASAQIQTFSGAVAQFGNALHEVLAALGDYIIKSPLVIGLIQLATKAFRDFLDVLDSKDDVIGNATRKVVNFGQAATMIVAPFEFLFNLLSLGFQATKLMIQQVLSDIANFDSLVTGLLAKVGIISEETAAGFKAAADTYSATLADIEAKTEATYNKLFDFNFTAKTEQILAQTKTFVDSFAKTLNTLPTKINPPFELVTKRMEQLRAALQQIVLHGMVNIVSTGVQHIGASLFSSGTHFADFRTKVYGILGDMSIQMGETMIAQSAAFTALAALIANPFTSAAASIAFGVALIALGGVLKAAAGAGAASGAGAAAGGGGGVAAGGGAGVAASTEAPATGLTTAQPALGTHVVVNVQGNILDRRQTGLELAEVINEAFRGSGVAFATGGL